MPRRMFALLFAALLGLPIALAAAPVRPAVEQAKIDFLLAEIESSRETFIRNGREYTGKKAASHLARKLRFAGKRVQTARDFVVGIGSRSLDSGKPYLVRASDGKERPLAEWLFERLDRYHRGLAKAAPASKPGG